MSMTKRQMKTMLAELGKALSCDEEALQAIRILDEKIENIEFIKPEKKHSLSNSFALPSEIVAQPDGYAVFSDGACRGNPGPGAWGVVAQNGEGELIFESSGLDINTTNNRMELEGAIQCLERLLDHWKENDIVSAPVFLYSDSKYVIEGLDKWVPGWKNRGWKKADGKAPENLELWQHLDSVRLKFSRIEFRWVRGHNGHPQNEYCDRLANEALDQSGF